MMNMIKYLKIITSRRFNIDIKLLNISTSIAANVKKGGEGSYEMAKKEEIFNVIMKGNTSSELINYLYEACKRDLFTSLSVNDVEEIKGNYILYIIYIYVFLCLPSSMRVYVCLYIYENIKFIMFIQYIYIQYMYLIYISTHLHDIIYKRRYSKQVIT